MKQLFGSTIAVFVIVVLAKVAQASNFAVSAQSPQTPPSVQSHPSFVEQLGDVTLTANNLFTSLGWAVVRFGEELPNCLGMMVCAVIPFVMLGLWALKFLTRSGVTFSG